MARGGQFAFAPGSVGKVPRQPFILFVQRRDLRELLRRAGAQLYRLAPERLEFPAQLGVGLLGCGRGGAGLLRSACACARCEASASVCRRACSSDAVSAALAWADSNSCA